MNKKTGIIIGVVAAVAVVGTILVLCLTGVFGGGSYPKDLASLQTAIADRAAINCEITHSEEEGTMTLQANEGWTKLSMSGTTEGIEFSTLAIKGDATYSWGEGMAFKTAFNDSEFDELAESLTEDESDEESAKITVICSSPSKNNFTVPEKDWFDATDLDY